MTQGEERLVALVTGAARGIGRVIIRRLLAEGYAVVLADIDGAAVAETAAGLVHRTPSCRCRRMSRTSPPCSR